MQIEIQPDRNAKKSKAVSRRLRHSIEPYLFISPAFIFLGVMTIYPMFYVIWLSLTSWDLMGTPKYVGLENFFTFFSDRNSLRILWVTGVFLIGDLLLTILPGFLLALALNQKIRMRGVLRAAALIPWAVTAVVAGVIWKWMLEPEIGVVSFLLSLIGLKIDFLLDPFLSLLTIIFVDSWRGIGYAAVFILAGLQSIDNEILEAARVDGARIWARFRYITLPLLTPSMLVLLILLTIHALNTVDVVLVVTGGGPMRMTETIAFHMYKEGLQYFNVGFGSSVGVLLLLINIILATIYFKSLERG